MPRKKKSSQTSRAPEKHAIIERYRQSGLTQRAFCEREGIAYSTFQYWLAQVRAEQMPAPSKKATAFTGGFLPLTPPAAAGSESTPEWEIEYPNGVLLRFGGEVDIPLLKELITLPAGDR